MESPLEDFTTRRFTPGTHYEPVAYNLSDLAGRTLALLHEVRTNSTRLEAMAQAAQAVAAEAFSFTGQLDTFMWAVLKVGWGVEGGRWGQDLCLIAALCLDNADTCESHVVEVLILSGQHLECRQSWPAPGRYTTPCR
jgi:hypothetical protein